MPNSRTRKTIARGKVTEGWVSARVEALAAHPLHCYRCMERAHAIQQCTLEIDRSKHCYKWRGSDQRASTCTAPLKCPLCADLRRPANHHLGGKVCSPPTARKRGKTKGKEQITEATPSSEEVPPSLAAKEGGREDEQPAITPESGHEEAMETAERWTSRVA